MPRITPVFLSFFIVSACASSPVATNDSTESQRQTLSGSFGHLTVHLSKESDRAGQVGVGISGQFVRHTEIDRPGALSALGIEQIKNRSSSDKHCELISESKPSSPISDVDFSLQLLDAGRLSLDVQGQTHTVLAKRFPDIFNLISGVIYGEEKHTISESEFPAGKELRITLRANGGQDVGSFELDLHPLPQFGKLFIGSHDSVESAPVISRRADLKVRWEKSPRQEGDLVILELRAAPGKSESLLRCQYKGTTVAVIPSRLLQSLSSSETRSRLTAKRFHRQTFNATGIDSGEVLLIVKESLDVILE